MMAETSAMSENWQVGAPYLDMQCGLGEGPYYEPATDTLRFVDIKKKQLHTVSVADGPASLKTLQFEEAVTVTADVDGRDPSRTILIGAKQGLALLDLATGKYDYLTKFPEEKPERIRSNDGGVDPMGRFWMGTMTDFGLGPFQPEGELLSSLS
jgi:sugar lactone lactonase YvrE